MHEELVLKGSVGPVDVAEVIDRRPLGLDPGGERLLDPDPERVQLRRAQPPRRPQRVDRRPEQRLVGVDVSDSGDVALVEQDRLHRGAASRSPW
jgi:hypothetical protein